MRERPLKSADRDMKSETRAVPPPTVDFLVFDGQTCEPKILPACRPRLRPDAEIARMCKMPKWEWEEENNKERAKRQGQERVYMLELPVSSQELFETIAPKEVRGPILEFAAKVIVADFLSRPIPEMPYPLAAHLDRYVRKWGVLNLAEFPADRDHIVLQEVKRLTKGIPERMTLFLRAAARHELGISALNTNAINSARQITNLDSVPQILEWAKSQPEYGLLIKYEKFLRDREFRTKKV